ncbi:MAG TPA: ABC transporter ATP-binding protein, partial [Reyranella sp.]|nr:ABC transporter ATP-binding protein [Reyranella sp.]
LWQLRDAEKRYSKRTVVRIASLDLRDRESVALIGSNGSGKSTLLRMIAGIATLSSGRLVQSEAAKALRQAIVPQSGGIYPGATVRENLRIHAGMHGVDLGANVAEAPYITRFGLSAFMDVQASRLSGGYQRLCAIACALCVAPSCLFMDEPYSGLDRQQTENLNHVIETLRTKLRFLAITGHFPESVKAGFRIVSLRNGELQ